MLFFNNMGVLSRASWVQDGLKRDCDDHARVEMNTGHCVSKANLMSYQICWFSPVELSRFYCWLTQSLPGKVEVALYKRAAPIGTGAREVIFSQF